MKTATNSQLPTINLSLLLLVLGVRTNHPHDPLAADDLAVFTDSFNAASYFHGFLASQWQIPTGELSTLSKIFLKHKWHERLAHA
jgi:hypothetical protein